MWGGATAGRPGGTPRPLRRAARARGPKRNRRTGREILRGVATLEAAILLAVRAHPIARKVRRADRELNMDLRRIAHPDDRDLRRPAKHRRTRALLRGS